MIFNLKQDLKNKSVKEIYHQYLLGQEVWYFKEYLKTENPSKTYDDFKNYISNGLDIHFNNIAIIGSAKTGLSFSPSKNFRTFTEKSDIDIVLVSQKHFNKIWNAYYEMYYRQIPFDEYQTVYKSIFKRFISLKNPTEKHKVIQEWVKTVNPFVKDLQQFFGIAQDINYRIYDSWESVERYHFFGITQLKNFIANNEERENKIVSIISSLKKHNNGNNK